MTVKVVCCSETWLSTINFRIFSNASDKYRPPSRSTNFAKFSYSRRFVFIRKIISLLPMNVLLNLCITLVFSTNHLFGILWHLNTHYRHKKNQNSDSGFKSIKLYISCTLPVQATNSNDKMYQLILRKNGNLMTW